MRVALTGTTGRVGAALARHLAMRHQVLALPRGVCDLADRSSLERALDPLDCEVFIHPAGLTNLETCEDDPALAMRVNADAPGEIAAWAARRGVRVIHFSTDYVFAGLTPGLRAETETPEPINCYGRSKLAGEHAVLAHPGNLVLRVSWVFGPEKPSFVDQIFTAALANRPLAAVADKFSLPTGTTDLARWVNQLLDRETTGILHACNPGDPVTWHGLATAVVREMTACGIISHCPEITQQTLEDMRDWRAPRPRFTAMDTSRLAAALGETPRPWPAALTEHVRLGARISCPRS